MDKVDLVNIYAHGLEGVEAAIDHEMERIATLETEVERLRRIEELTRAYLDVKKSWDNTLRELKALKAALIQVPPTPYVRISRTRLAEMQTAETEVKRLRAIEQIGRNRIGKNITRPGVYHAAGQDTNHRLCLALIALDEWRAAVDVIGKDKVGRNDG